jgi:hypothetical protein
MTKRNTTKSQDKVEIKQIIPAASGWQLVYEDSTEPLGYITQEIVCWAVVKITNIDRGTVDKIVPCDRNNVTVFPCFEGEPDNLVFIASPRTSETVMKTKVEAFITAKRLSGGVSSK